MSLLSIFLKEELRLIKRDFDKVVNKVEGKSINNSNTNSTISGKGKK